MKSIVLGAGIAGVTTAYYLARDGRAVTVLDRRPGVALETSFANAGLVAPGHSYTWASPRAPKILLKSLFVEGQALRLRLNADPHMWAWCVLFLRNCTAARSRENTARKVRLCRYAQHQLQQLTANEQLQYDGIRRGLLYLYRDAASFERGRANMTILVENGLQLETLDAAQVAQREPALAQARERIAGAIYCPTDESGDAHQFTRQLQRACERLGVRFVFDAPISRIEATADRITGVRTSAGLMEGDDYVLALGSYSPILARPLGYRLAIYPVKGYSATFPVGPAHRPPQMGGVDENHLVAWARFGERLRFTATAEFAGYDTHHTPADFDSILRTARELFPDGADYTKPGYWAGLRPMTPEGTPLIGATRHRNLFLNTGHGHMGWTMACGTARLLADIMAGRTPELDMTGMTIK
ncbi:D-amino acid dehydrogenase [Paraburkholderia sp. LEh10]|uniref:D-amino acid dehydrogenase n=1 Tax=Paraburkholderia sp. LEh10 TaxID=2821353 RepID=UPI001AEB4341|nr:D-amino acid dehydrogenase [Paraburkholderia sp. LEh10]MBP0590685.1 D-amino acid dehydrogenase [Paraburkholderia sp. LEh10]